ncbi:DUF1028 domain-containing protein [Rhodococcus ruber]|uniref:DUF1028 domain-containing protein n=1 Tax=Rhodococcus ruber TaxID=1830 RepID=A0ABT4MMS4_9NOCA|nr:DUF1028 domain-containing protein [Rhodococcus ruber]MCZ4522297.1 DUF1028 domain-containing protein [Rhodococcus ruber]
MTLSIVARDPDTGQLGIACQSHFFGVGRLVGWLEPGVGAVATQAFVNVGLGPQGLALLRSGATAQQALQALSRSEDDVQFRQLAVVDCSGEVASQTGGACVPAAGSVAGRQVSVQGNMLTSHEVYREALAAYELARDAPFVDRLLAALQAGERAGGDARGSQSAVLKVVTGRVSSRPWEETIVDVRVDDHHDPVAELTRLAGLSKAYDGIGSVLFARGLMLGPYVGVSSDELTHAILALEEARKTLGENFEAAFWYGVLLGRAGRVEEACHVLLEVVAAQPRWGRYLRSVVEAEIIKAEILDPVFAALDAAEEIQ